MQTRVDSRHAYKIQIDMRLREPRVYQLYPFASATAWHPNLLNLLTSQSSSSSS